MAEMSKSELLALLKGQLADTTIYANDDFKSKQLELLKSYNRDKTLYENEEGRSQVVASDHYDTVESDLPALARIFLGASDVLKFSPLGADDVEEAEQKTRYANYLIREQRDSFKTQIDFLKQAGMAQCAVLKYYMAEEEKPEYVNYEGLSEDELTVLVKNLESEKNVARVEPIEHDSEDDTYNVRFRIVRKVKRIRICGVQPDKFIMTRGAASKDDAQLVGDESVKTKGELIAEGYPEERIKKLRPNKDPRGNQIDHERLLGQGGYDEKRGQHWTLEEVTIQSLYPLVDYDGDGIPERRCVMKIGEEIFENEPFGHVPYAILSQITMPHTAIGKSRGEMAASVQEEKTALKRGLMDNIYEVNRPRTAVDDSDGSIDGGKVDLDDFLSHQIGGIVRVDGNPMEAIMPLVTPYIGDKALQVIQYIDAGKSESLGTFLANQGLDADSFYNETATRFEGIEDHRDAKIELVARVAAETAYRDLYEGVIWLAQHYQDEETEIQVLGKPLIVDPRGWRYEHYCQSEVGLGAGDSSEAIQNLSAQFNVQMMLRNIGSPVVDDTKIYNTLADLTKVMGKPDASRYFNDPTKPEQVLQAQNQILSQMVQQLQAQTQQNPLAEAELIKAQAKMKEVEGKETLSMRKFLLEMSQKAEQFDKGLAKELTELELKYGRDVPGAQV